MEKINTPAVETRKARIEQARKILTAKAKITYEKAVALLSWNLGISERKAKEYIHTLVLVDGIKREGDLVVRRK